MEEGWETGERAAAAGGCVAVYLRLQGRIRRSSGVTACRPCSAARRRRAAPSDDLTPAPAAAGCSLRPPTRLPCCGAPGRGQLEVTPRRPPPALRPPSVGRYIQLSLLMLLLALLRISECCSSRANPRPRSPSPSTRRPYTFQTQPCPAMYQEHYCLNGATCFKVNIGHSPLYNCECADGFMGQRCEFKDLDGSYSRSRDAILETASIAGGAGVALLVCVLLSGLLYVWSKRRRKLAACSAQQRAQAVRFNLSLPPASHVVQIPANRSPLPADVIQLQRADRWSPADLTPLPPLHKAVNVEATPVSGRSDSGDICTAAEPPLSTIPAPACPSQSHLHPSDQPP